MFPDSAIAQCYSSAETKTRYLTSHGLAPHFLSQLKEQVKGQEYVLLFDESLNKKNQFKQLDIHVRYWDDSQYQVCSRYFTSAFMGHAASTDLLETLMENIDSLLFKDILQISMDGPAVNWKLHSMLQQKLCTDYTCKLLDIGKSFYNFHNQLF